MDLEDVFVRALEVYHTIQRIYGKSAPQLIFLEELHTINVGDTGAFNASPISCTFALTLALRVLIVLNASVKLFCLLCLPPVLADPFAHEAPFEWLSLLGAHLSSATGLAVYPFVVIAFEVVVYGDIPSMDST